MLELEQDQVTRSDPYNQNFAQSKAAEALLKKLAQQDELRVAEREKKKEENTENVNPDEDSTKFLRRFHGLRYEVETLLGDSSDSNPVAIEKRRRQSMALLRSMEDFLASSTYFLPSYDLKRCSEILTHLRAQIETLSRLLGPEKKKKLFEFGRRTGGLTRPSSTASSSATLCRVKGEAISSSAAAAASDSPAFSTSSNAGAGGGSFAAAPPAAPGVSGLRGRAVYIPASSLSDRDFALTDLTDCLVILCGTPAALRLRELRRCVVVAAPVRGPLFVDDVAECKVALAARQVRIHSTSDTDFYLRASSKPIIEHSKALRFAPFPSPSSSSSISPSPSSSSSSSPSSFSSSATLGAAESPLDARLKLDVFAASPSAASPSAASPSAASSTGALVPVGTSEKSAGEVQAELRDLMAQCDLGGEDATHFCFEVEDFGWVKTIKSPNWSILHPEARLPLERLLLPPHGLSSSTSASSSSSASASALAPGPGPLAAPAAVPSVQAAPAAPVPSRGILGNASFLDDEDEL